MNYAKGRHPGAVWKKTDFEIHTPRDPQWSGSPNLSGGTSAAEVAREQWAAAFVKKCVDDGLGAIAITDHHDFCFIPYVQKELAKIDETVRPWLFPGVEITCDDSVQCLVLFDVNSSPELRNRIFGKMPSIVAADKNGAKCPQAELCGKNLEDLIKEILDDNHVSPISILLPHAGDDGSHKTLMRQGFHDRFKGLQIDGVYAGKKLPQLSEVTVRRIHGQIKEWGDRRRGLITVGDNRHQDFRDLGSNPTWIKLGEPTAESIRQAVLADEARIAYSLPHVPAQRILELKIESTLTGNSFELVINDGFTALIGGRGSGKSAILEYLRFGLGRSSIDVGLNDDESKREKDLIAETLRGGRVTVTLERDGVIESWTRQGDARDTIQVTVEESQTESITIPAAQQRFRARAFSQKQLSTLVITSKATDQITGIAAAESINKRQEIDEAIARTQREIQAAVQRAVEFWVAEAEHKNAFAAVRDLQRRIDASKKKLESSGLSADSQSVLDQAPAFRSAGSLLNEADGLLLSELDNLEGRIDPLAGLSDARWEKVSSFDEVKAFGEEVKRAQEIIKKSLDQVQEALVALKIASDTAKSKFVERLTAFQAKHRAALAEQNALKSQIQELDKLTNELQEAEARERNAARRELQLGDAKDRLSSARKSLGDQLKANRQLLESAAIKVGEMSNNLLLAEVRQEHLPQEYISALVNICENQRVRDSGDRCESRVAQIIAAGEDEWTKVADSFLEILRARVQAGSSVTEPSEETVKLLHNALFELTPQQTISIYTGLTADKVSKVIMAAPSDFIAFEYKDKSAYIPFEKASPGQQAAALLNLLLQQEAGTLIIDQPEDDLDNKVIMDIVKLLQTAKQKRQLIFATHNANFVVNGDADKVVALAAGGAIQEAATARISIELDGAIETPNVAKLITETVEGGEKAFELRRRKYKISYSI